jgi:hypothetical protein
MANARMPEFYGRVMATGELAHYFRSGELSKTGSSHFFLDSSARRISCRNRPRLVPPKVALTNLTTTQGTTCVWSLHRGVKELRIPIADVSWHSASCYESHTIQDSVHYFGTKKEAEAFAVEAAKAWVDALVKAV